MSKQVVFILYGLLAKGCVKTEFEELLIEVVAGLQVIEGRWTRANMFKVFFHPRSNSRIMTSWFVSVTRSPVG